MSNKKEYEEKLRHGTIEFPVGLHKIKCPKGVEVLFYLHWHQEFEFLVLTEGKILFTIQDREYILKKGDCVFVNSNLLHSAKNISEDGCAFFALDFSYEALEKDMHSHFAKKYILPVLQGKYVFREVLSYSADTEYEEMLPILEGGIPEVDDFINDMEKNPKITWQQSVINDLSQICRCPEHDLISQQIFVKSKLLAIWNIMYNHGIRKGKNELEDYTNSERLLPVIKYIEENYNDEITLGELAGILPMSEGQFCRVFKKNMKMSPTQYIMKYRILQSCRLLYDTDKKIGDIANMTGFNNISYFNKVFLKIIGCTPKEYRKNSNF